MVKFAQNTNITALTYNSVRINSSAKVLRIFTRAVFEVNKGTKYNFPKGHWLKQLNSMQDEVLKNVVFMWYFCKYTGDKTKELNNQRFVGFHTKRNMKAFS